MIVLSIADNELKLVNTGGPLLGGDLLLNILTTPFIVVSRPVLPSGQGRKAVARPLFTAAKQSHQAMRLLMVANG